MEGGTEIECVAELVLWAIYSPLIIFLAKRDPLFFFSAPFVPLSHPPP